MELFEEPIPGGLDLEALTLLRGPHIAAEEGYNFAEAIAHYFGLPFSDEPLGVGWAVTYFGLELNDAMPDGPRQTLKRLIPSTMHTCHSGEPGQVYYDRLCLDRLLHLGTVAARCVFRANDTPFDDTLFEMVARLDSGEGVSWGEIEQHAGRWLSSTKEGLRLAGPQPDVSEATGRLWRLVADYVARRVYETHYSVEADLEAEAAQLVRLWSNYDPTAWVCGVEALEQIIYYSKTVFGSSTLDFPTIQSLDDFVL